MQRPRLSKTNIEYGDYAWNFYSGCLHTRTICPIAPSCWAKRITQRFKAHYPNGFEPTFYPEAFVSPLMLKKPSRILCAFMGDLFGDWVDPFEGHGQFGKDEMGYFTLKGRVFDTIEKCPQHTFIFLTKCPENLLTWSLFPENTYIGVSVTNQEMHNRAIACLSGIEASVKFISYEPLLSEIQPIAAYDFSEIQWVIIGQQTPVKEATMPKIEWVKEIVEACDKTGIPVFLKNNLKKLIYDAYLTAPDGYSWAWNTGGGIRQGFPLVVNPAEPRG